MNQHLVGEVRLPEWGLIRASGADARSFLHSQLTQDMLHLTPDQARLAGFCSAKGRLQASFVVWADGDDVLLACSADLLPAVLRRLSMFVLRAKCVLRNASEELSLSGVARLEGSGLAASPWPAAPWRLVREGSTCWVRLPDARTPAGPVERALRVQPLSEGSASSDSLPASVWNWLEALSGTARVVAATVDQFVPQMVNLEVSGGVNFQKGCYPGQEVVARSQYRGTLKRRGYLALGEELLAPGDEIYHADDPDQPAGTVVLSGVCDGQAASFVSLKTDAANTGALHARSPNGSLLSLAPLPYPMPVAVA